MFIQNFFIVARDEKSLQKFDRKNFLIILNNVVYILSDKVLQSNKA